MKYSLCFSTNWTPSRKLKGGIIKKYKKQDSGDTLSIKFSNPKFGKSFFFFLILGKVQHRKQAQAIEWCLYCCEFSL